MTSKEALEKIKEIIRSTRDTDLIHFYHLSTDLTDKEVEMFNVIEKDLEKYEILKKEHKKLKEAYEHSEKCSAILETYATGFQCEIFELERYVKVLEKVKKHIINFGDGTNEYLGFEINDDEEDYYEIKAWLSEVEE